MSSESPVVVMNKEGSIILCVIDFSDHSKDALLTAFKMAHATTSSLTVLYPYRLNQPRNVPDVSQWKRTIEADAANSFNRMTSSLLQDSDVRCDFKAEVGFVDDRIEVFTEKHDVSLIVISSELVYKSDGAFLDMLQTLRSPLFIVPKKRNAES